MDTSLTDVLRYWPLFIIGLPILGGIFAVTVAPFMTVKNKHASFKSLLRFSIACGIIAVGYGASAIAINTATEYSRSNDISRSKKDIDFDVYQFNARIPGVHLVSRTLNANTYEGGNQDFLTTRGVYIEEKYAFDNGGTQRLVVRQFNNSKVPASNISNCMPISPLNSYAPQKLKGADCIFAGKNGINNNIYDARRINVVTKNGYIFYYYDGLSTVYGNTRITVDRGTDSTFGKELPGILSDVKKTDVNKLKFYEEVDSSSKVFILPSLF